MLIPDHETAVDFLNYEAISRTVVELLNDNRKRPLTIEPAHKSKFSLSG